MRKLSFRRTLLLTIHLMICAFSKLSAQDPKCPPLPIPYLNYLYAKDLGPGIGAELDLWFCPKKCDCEGSFGFACYLYGPTASIKTNYYPGAKAFDISAAFGYRSLGMLFLKPEMTAGYTIAAKNTGRSFFHVDPALGFDAAIANISFGYSFRSVKIDNKNGAFVFKVGLSPAIFFTGTKQKKTLSSLSGSSLKEIKRNRRRR